MSTPAKKPPETAALSGAASELTAGEAGLPLTRFDRTEAAMGRIVTVLLASALEEDHLTLQHIFSHSRWNLLEAHDLPGALQLLRETAIAVVICERDLPPGDWKGMLQMITRLTDPPLLIVNSRLADDYLWAEALNLGAYDVLATPFDREEVTRVVSLAWLHWKDQFGRGKRDLKTPRTAGTGGRA